METGEAKVVHDFCVLLGFGADAVCPYMVFETMYRLRYLGLLDKELNDDMVWKCLSGYVKRDDTRAASLCFRCIKAIAKELSVASSR